MNDRERAALHEYAALADDRAAASAIYENLWAEEACRLFLAGNGGFARSDEGTKRELFESFFGGEPTGRRVAAALGLCAGAEPDFFVEEDQNGGIRTIALTENRFSSLLRAAFHENASFLPAQGFEDACDKTAGGEVDGCLLPYLDGDGRPLPRSEKLCAEYGLKKTRLIIPDEEERVTWALCRRTVSFCRSPGFAELSFDGARGDKEALRLLCRRLSVDLTIRAHRGGALAALTPTGDRSALKTVLVCAPLLLCGAAVEGFGECDPAPDGGSRARRFTAGSLETVPSGGDASLPT